MTRLNDSKSTSNQQAESAPPAVQTVNKVRPLCIQPECFPRRLTANPGCTNSAWSGWFSDRRQVWECARTSRTGGGVRNVELSPPNQQKARQWSGSLRICKRWQCAVWHRCSTASEGSLIFSSLLQDIIQVQRTNLRGRIVVPLPGFPKRPHLMFCSTSHTHKNPQPAELVLL